MTGAIAAVAAVPGMRHLIGKAIDLAVPIDSRAELTRLRTAQIEPEAANMRLNTARSAADAAQSARDTAKVQRDTAEVQRDTADVQHDAQLQHRTTSNLSYLKKIGNTASYLIVGALNVAYNVRNFQMQQRQLLAD
jgi:hypothetical protein